MLGDFIMDEWWPQNEGKTSKKDTKNQMTAIIAGIFWIFLSSFGLCSLAHSDSDGKIMTNTIPREREREMLSNRSINFIDEYGLCGV